MPPGKGQQTLPRRLEDDRIGQLPVEVIPRILDGHDAASPDVGDHRDLLPAVAAQREQKGVHLLVICVDLMDDIFLSLYCIC